MYTGSDGSFDPIVPANFSEFAANCSFVKPDRFDMLKYFDTPNVCDPELLIGATKLFCLSPTSVIVFDVNWIGSFGDGYI